MCTYLQACTNVLLKFLYISSIFLNSAYIIKEQFNLKNRSNKIFK